MRYVQVSIVFAWTVLLSLIVAPATVAQDDDDHEPEVRLEVGKEEKTKLLFTEIGAFTGTAEADAVAPADPETIATMLSRGATAPPNPRPDKTSSPYVLDIPGIAVRYVRRNALLTISWSKDIEKIVIDFYDLIESDGRLSNGYCGYLGIEPDATSLSFLPTGLRCARFGGKGGPRLGKSVLLEVKVGTGCTVGPVVTASNCQFSYIVLPNHKGTFLGESLGFAVSYLDVWDEGTADGVNRDEGFRANKAGAGFYYSLANIRTKRVRWITNVLALDFVEDIDLELGLGTGLAFKITDDEGSTPGFGISAGVGYNLMVDRSEQAWYTFVAMTVEIGGKGK